MVTIGEERGDEMRLVGMMGEARSGKDSIADNVLAEYDYVKVPFALSLKNASKEIFGFNERQLYGDLKEVVDEYWGETPRAILQKLGTDALRNVWQDVWIQSLKKRLDILSEEGYTNFVVPDVRFKNEFNAIKEWGGEIWRLYRVDGPGAQGGVSNHPSEVEMKSIPDSEFNAVITAQSGDMQSLYSQARENWKRFDTYYFAEK